MAETANGLVVRSTAGFVDVLIDGERLSRERNRFGLLDKNASA